MAAAARLAVGTLTIIPAGPPPPVDRATAGRAMAAAPLAVAPLALVVASLGWLAGLGRWPDSVAGLVVVAALAVGSRALHLDGLADTVDGFGSGRDRERALAVMRRGDIGPMGVVALVITLGLQAAAAGELTVTWRTAALLAVVICVSRTALVLACRAGVPAARADGLGAAVAGTVPVSAAVVLSVLGVMGVATAGGLAGSRWWAAGAGAALALLAVLLLVRQATRTFGGVTGDVLGAGVEVALTVMLLGALL